MAIGKKIGLYFGTFNPIHLGHVGIANYMVNFTQLDEVWLVVSPHNPFKIKDDLLNDYARLEMARLAIEGMDNIKVTDIEFSLSRPSYTSHTLIDLRGKYSDHHFSLILGRDNLNTFHKWKDYQSILSHHDLYVYPRLNSSKDDFDDHYKVHLVDAPIIDISSSLVRQKIQNRKDVCSMLPKSVWKYIEKMKYYM